MNSGAKPNGLSEQLVKQVYLKTEKTNNIVAVASGNRSGILKKVTDTFVRLDKMELRFVFLRWIIFSSILKLESRIKNHKGVSWTSKSRRFVLTTMVGNRFLKWSPSKHEKHWQERATDREDFTADLEEEGFSPSEIEDNVNDVLILTIKENDNENRRKDDVRHDLLKCRSNAISGRLSNVPWTAQNEIRNLVHSDFIASTLHDLWLSLKPSQHSFAINDTKPIYDRIRRIVSKRNGITGRQRFLMQKTGVITRTIFSWSFLVFLLSEKDGKARFCVDYLALNRKMMAGGFPLLKTKTFWRTCWRCLFRHTWMFLTLLPGGDVRIVRKHDQICTPVW